MSYKRKCGRNGAHQQKNGSARSSVYRNQIKYLIETDDVTSTRCNRNEAMTSSMLLVQSEQHSRAITTLYVDVAFWHIERLQKKEATSPNSWAEGSAHYFSLLPIPNDPAQSL